MIESSFYVDTLKIKKLQDLVKVHNLYFKDSFIIGDFRCYVVLVGDVENFNAFNRDWSRATTPIVEKKSTFITRTLRKIKGRVLNFIV